MKPILLITCIIIFVGCNNNPDFSNPKDVVISYQKLINKGKIDKAFKLVSDSSKKILTYQDFRDYYDVKLDSAINANSFIIIDIIQMPIEVNFPDYRSYEIKEIAINKILKDSTTNYYYISAKNQSKNGWRVVWTKQLESAARQLQGKSKYTEALRVCDNILNLDPNNGDAYQLKAWIYFRLSNNRLLEENGIKAIDLAPKSPISHILMSAIYDSKGLYESAKLSNLKALSFTNDPEQKSQIFSNTSIYCEHLDQPDSAIYYLRKAISNISKTHALWRLAINFAKKNITDSSAYYFEKAIINVPMDNYLQVQLYCDYSDFLLKHAMSLTKGSSDQKANIIKAKNMVLKALDLDANDTNAKLILDKFKNL